MISCAGPCAVTRPPAMTTISSAMARMRSWWEMMTMDPLSVFCRS